MRAAAADAGFFAADAGGAMVLFWRKTSRAHRPGLWYNKENDPEKGGPGHEKTADFSWQAQRRR